MMTQLWKNESACSNNAPGKETAAVADFEPEKVQIQPAREGDYVGVKLTYSGAPLIDYETSMNGVGSVSEQAAGSTFTSSTLAEGLEAGGMMETETDYALPVFKEVEQGYEVKMRNPFYAPTEEGNENITLDSEQFEGFNELFSLPQYNVTISMPGKVFETNTP